MVNSEYILEILDGRKFSFLFYACSSYLTSTTHHTPTCLIPHVLFWAYGPADLPRYKKAQTNFVESLAAYSLVRYLQIKDRHNGN